jgi:hypothetical protein
MVKTDINLAPYNEKLSTTTTGKRSNAVCMAGSKVYGKINASTPKASTALAVSCCSICKSTHNKGFAASKAGTAMALGCITYNLKRAINILGAQEMMVLLA